jgi:hypothetical protein
MNGLFEMALPVLLRFFFVFSLQYLNECIGNCGNSALTMMTPLSLLSDCVWFVSPWKALPCYSVV